MIVYHGSNVEVHDPDLVHSRKAIDFGKGFYVTPIRDQAVVWSEKRRRRYGTAILSSYELDEVAMSALKVLKFDSYSASWLDFIVECRAERDATDWDVVIGGVADDKVFDVLEAYFDGFYSREQTIESLKFKKPNLQICLRTPAAIATIKFVRSDKP